jgi:membrane protein
MSVLGNREREQADREPATGAVQEQERTTPERLSGLDRSSWIGAMRRTWREFRADELTDVAAALTYYGVLAIFPGLLAVVSILGLIGHSATQPLIENVDKLAPGTARTIFTSAVQNIEHGRGTAGIVFVVSLAGALWSASGYVAAFMRASNRIYGVGEGRPVWKTIPVRIGVTLALVVLLVVSSVAVVLTGALAGRAGSALGVGGTAVTIWDIVKWPVLVMIVSFMFALLYWASPNVRHPGLRWVSPGGLLAVLTWIVASAGFALYVANFSSYNRTYGALAAIIVFLVWLWISNIAVLLGAELNAELERAREIEGGAPPEREPFLRHRDTRKLRPEEAHE